MSSWQFDLDQFRKNWERAAETPPNELPAKFAQVEAPKDAFKEARAVLERVRTMAFSDLEKRRNELAPFFDRVEDAIKALEEGADKKKAAALEKALADLEDIVAVFSEIWR